LVVGKYLLDKASFIRLADVASDLPPYEESVINVRMDAKQKKQYDVLQWKLQEAVKEYGNLALASMLQALLSYPDSCCCFPEHIEIKDRETKSVMEVIQAPQIGGLLLPKEAELVSIAKSEKDKGRKTLCYMSFTNSRDIRPRLQQVLEDAGLRVGVLDASVEPKKREEWIQQHSNDLDVLLVNPELVKTGLDLYQFPTVVFFQTGYNIFTVRQAARRSWRIGQTQPVKVYFLCYQSTMQEVALYLVADKLETALMVEGELPDGLADYGSNTSSVFEELAKALVSGDRYSADVKWASFRKKEAEINTELMPSVPAVKYTLSNAVIEDESATEHVIVKISLKKKGKKRQSVDVSVGELNNDEKFKNRAVQLALF
jgi:SNF2 family DNA or RNA helicase